MIEDDHILRLEKLTDNALQCTRRNERALDQLSATIPLQLEAIKNTLEKNQEFLVRQNDRVRKLENSSSVIEERSHNHDGRLDSHAESIKEVNKRVDDLGPISRGRSGAIGGGTGGALVIVAEFLWRYLVGTKG